MLVATDRDSNWKLYVEVIEELMPVVLVFYRIKYLRHAAWYLEQIKAFESSMALRCRSFSEKNIDKKHLCHHDKNYYYFWKSNIPVIKLIVDSRNMIEVSKIMSL